MNWIIKLFRKNKPLASIGGAVIYLDIDMLSAEQIERIKLRMTPVFVEFSGRKAKRCGCDFDQALKQSPAL